MCKNIAAGIIGGVILFIWGAISWTVLPWHETTIHQFIDVKEVAHVIHNNSTASGIYMMPMHAKASAGTTVEENKQLMKKEEHKHAEAKEEAAPGPMVFAAVTLEGMPTSMGKAMGISLASQIVAALLVSWLLLQARGLSYCRRLAFVTLFGLAAGVVSHVPYWNWLGFDLQFTLVQMADLIIGWFLAGLVMAKLCNKK